MKMRIFGRKVGSGKEMVLLIESDGVSTGGQAVAEGVISEFVIASARRSVHAVRQNNIEGYVLFEGDPTRYEFTADADFVYPASVH